MPSLVVEHTRLFVVGLLFEAQALAIPVANYE
jgi:hypothetical protein